MSEKVRDLEIAAEWGVSPVTVRRWRQQGLIPFFRVGRRVVRYDAAAVRQAIERRSPVRLDETTSSGTSQHASDPQAPQASEVAQ